MDKQAKETLFPSHVSQRGTNGKTLTKILLEEPKGVSLLRNTPSSLGATFRPATSVGTFEQILWLQIEFWLQRIPICPELERSDWILADDKWIGDPKNLLRSSVLPGR